MLYIAYLKIMSYIAHVEFINLLNMNYLKYALEKQKENSGIEIFGAVETDLVQSVEQQLGIVFPEQYKAFLLECGSCSIYDTYISGLFRDWDNATSTGSTLHDTLEARANHKLPLNYIVLEYSEDENYYVLKVSPDSSENGKVYSVDIDDNDEVSKFTEVFSSFEEYFKFTLD